MCGIVGIQQRSRPVDRNDLIRMRDVMRHRGPDAEGIFESADGQTAFGFRRLSIIDLSSAGDQPIVEPGRDTALVFNGEVFNFAALRAELIARGYSFRSHGDAEVVLKSYLADGPGCIERFQGMFAFGVWDGAERTLFLGRDRFGIKPLYYYHTPSLFIFSSELKGILEHPDVRREIDPDALDDYFTYGYVPHDRAIIRGVRKLPAGHTLTLRDGEATIRSYWDLDYNPVRRSSTELVDELRTRLASAVDLWSVSDVPVGIFLSGGVDSSAVCALAGGGSRTQTYSIGFDYEQQNELPFARAVANHCSTDHHERIVSVGDAAAVLSKLAEVYDEPFYDTSAVPTYFLSRYTAENVKVALGGDGGDEIFFGYHWYTNFLDLERGHQRRPLPGANALISAMRRLPMGARLAGLDRYTTDDSMQRYFRLVGFLDDYEKRAIVPSANRTSERDPLWLFRRFYRDDLPPVAALRLLDIKTYLVDDILTKVDRASMANSLEVRTPLLEHTLAEFAMTVPVEDIFRDNEKKWLFKRAMEGTLPHDIIYRKKRGFSAPVRHWLRTDLAAVVRERLIGGYAVADGVLDPKAITSMIDNFTHNRWAKLWLLLMFEGWYRRWIRNIHDEEKLETLSGGLHVG